MRNYITIFLFFACVQISLAQKSHTDSLIARLNALPDNETRFPLLEQLSADPNDFGIKQKYANQGLAFSIKLNRPKDQEKFLHDIAQAEIEIDDGPSSLATSFRGLQLSRSLKDSYYTSQFLHGIGYSYILRNDLRIAASYFRESIQAAQAIKDTLEVVRSSSNLESEYTSMHKLDSARYFTENEYRLVTQSKNKEVRDMTANVLADFGEVQSGLNHPDSALQYYYRALPFFIRNKSYLSAYTALLIAKVYLKTNRPDSAEKYALDTYRRSRDIRRYDWVVYSAEILSQLFEGKNDAKSLFYYKAAMAAKDSVSGDDKTKRFQAAVYAEQQRQADLNYAAINYQDKIRFFAAIAGLLLVTIVGLILWFTNKKQRKSNHLLAQQKQQVENTLKELKLTQQQLIQSEKMASLGELTAGIAHEIQNPLNFVNNFAEVNEEMLEELKAESEKQKAERNKQLQIDLINDIIENEKKIRHHGKRADAIVKGMLQHSQMGKGTKEPADINSLAEERLRLTYHAVQSKNPDFHAEMSTSFEADLPKVNVIPQDIGKVLLNLFNNAFYAVNQKSKTAGPDYRPEVSVTTASANGLLVIRVKDNGNGIPDAIKDKIMQPFFTTKPAGEGTGLGLSLSYDIVVKGHGGRIEVNNIEGAFTEFIIELPFKQTL